MELKKPLAVLERRRESGSTLYEVVGVVRKKLLFSERPRAVVQSSSGPKRARVSQSSSKDALFAKAARSAPS